MKILLVNTLFGGPEYGGAEKSVGLLAHALIARGHGVTVVSLSPRSERAPIREKSEDGLESRRVELINFYWPFHPNSKKGPVAKFFWHALDSFNPLMKQSMRECLDEGRFDVVITNNLAGFSSAVWHLFSDYQLPIVHVVRDYYLLCPRSSMFRNGASCRSLCKDCRFLSWKRRRDSVVVDAVIGISNTVLATHLANGLFKEASSHVVGNPVELPKKALQPRGMSEPLSIGFIGRILPEKGVELMLSAIRRAQIDPLIFIAGGGAQDYLLDLHEMGRGMNITWLGRVDPSDFFGKIDLLVVPSIWSEPFGRVIIEAFGYGVPCLVYASGGGAELIDSATGWLASTVDGFADRLRWCAENMSTVRDMKQHCRAKAEQYQPAMVAEKIEEILVASVDRKSSVARPVL